MSFLKSKLRRSAATLGLSALQSSLESVQSGLLTVARMSRYDLVVYGASGFTGQFVVEYVHRAAEEQGLSWAVAGRSEGKLRSTLDSAGAMVEAELSGTPIIVSYVNIDCALLRQYLPLNCPIILMICDSSD